MRKTTLNTEGLGYDPFVTSGTSTAGDGYNRALELMKWKIDNKLKKNIYTMKTTLFFVLGIILVYLFTSFIFWDLNPSHWNEGARFLCAMFGTICGSCFVMAKIINN